MVDVVYVLLESGRAGPLGVFRELDTAVSVLPQDAEKKPLSGACVDTIVEQWWSPTHGVFTIMRYKVI